jgi:hypothetical protein
MLITLGDGTAGALASAEGFTGATGITLFAPDEAKSAPAGRIFGDRSIEGNCIFLGLLAPPVAFLP